VLLRMKKNCKYALLQYIKGGERFCESSVQIPERLARLLITEIALGLEYLHYASFAHADLTDQNLLLGMDGHIVLLGFGTKLVYCTPLHDTSRTYVGENVISPPETIHGIPNTNSEILRDIPKNQWYKIGICGDWWMLGVILYEMLTMKIPTNQTPFREFTENCECFPSHFTENVKDLLKKFCAKDISKRIKSSSEFFRHPFLEGINLEDIILRKFPLSFPKSVDENIDPEFLTEDITGESDNYQSYKHFGVFTYNPNTT